MYTLKGSHEELSGSAIRAIFVIAACHLTTLSHANNGFINYNCCRVFKGKGGNLWILSTSKSFQKAFYILIQPILTLL